MDNYSSTNNSTTSFTLPLKQGTMIVRFSLEDGHIQKYTWESKRHCNAEYELHVILQGNCVIDVEDTQFKLSPQQAILIAPGKYHLAQPAPGKFERLSLGFEISDSDLLRSLRRTVPQCNCFSLSSDFQSFCQKFVLETNNQNPFKETMQQTLIAQILVSLFRQQRLAQHTQSHNAHVEEAERTHIIDNYFETYFMEKGGCSVLAKQLNLSTRQLNRVLQERYGMSFQEKLIQAKMDYSALLLRTTNKTIQDIMSLVGYSSATTFYKAFYVQFHVTPKEYRQHSK